MPKPNQSSSYRPQYVSAFQPDSNGIPQNNSAQTQMHVGLQKIILEQGGGQKKALESEHMQRRQDVVDEYLRALGGPEKLRTPDFVVTLPKVASPQPIHTGLLGNKIIAPKRQQQENDFAGSFLAKNKVTLGFVYEEIDIAINRINDRKENLTFSQKRTWSSKRIHEFTYEPLYKAVEMLDSHFAEEGDPLRIKWREVKTAPGHTSVNLYFIFPNTKAQYERGFRTWMGSENVVDP